MGMGRYVVDAVLLEGRSARELARAHGVSKSWVYELIRRYREGGHEALEPHSRRLRSCKHETSPEIVGAILELRRELEAQGRDAGAETIAYHLAEQVKEVPSVSTIWRILRREGLLVPEPQKRPRASLIRFEADLPKRDVGRAASGTSEGSVRAWGGNSVTRANDEPQPQRRGRDPRLGTRTGEVVAQRSLDPELPERRSIVKGADNRRLTVGAKHL